MESTKGGDNFAAPRSLHDVVLNYITTQAYASTAQALSRGRISSEASGSSTNGTTTNGHGKASSNGTNGHGPSNGDDGDVDMDGGDGPSTDKAKGKKKDRGLAVDALESIERRRSILNHILNGAIMRAVDALNTHFPSVLSDPPPTLPSSDSSSNGHFPSTTISSAYPSSLLKLAGLDHSIPVFSHSLHPDHLRLNLQIQQFIESFRQLAPPSNPSSPSSSIGSLASSMHASMQASMHASHSAGTLQHALTAAQGLHQEAKKLKPDERAVYLQEIKDVGALFAYTDPETSILKGYLDQGRRIALAEQINRAILQSEGRSTQSSLEHIARRTTALWSIMQARNIESVPEWTAADGHGKEQLAIYVKGMNGKGFKLRDFVSQTWG